MTKVPLRTVEERITFCDDYFSSVQARVVYDSEHYREYELPRDVDKELTDRPFYWMWVEQTNQDVQPTILRLAFTEEALERENARLRQEALAEAEKQNLNEIQKMFFRPPTAELITVGSFRLDKIHASLDKRGRFCTVVPCSWHEGQRLVPWLMINATVSYRCDLAQQEFVSVGVCLTNGQIVDNFYNMIYKIEMKPVLPSQLMQSAKLTVDQGIDRYRDTCTKKLQFQSHEWATSAAERLQQEIRQIRTYYNSILPDVPEHEKPLVDAERVRKERDLTERIEPRIEWTPRQVALIGLLER